MNLFIFDGLFNCFDPFLMRWRCWSEQLNISAAQIHHLCMSFRILFMLNVGVISLQTAVNRGSSYHYLPPFKTLPSDLMWDFSKLHCLLLIPFSVYYSVVSTTTRRWWRCCWTEEPVSTLKTMSCGLRCTPPLPAVMQGWWRSSLHSKTCRSTTPVIDDGGSSFSEQSVRMFRSVGSI